MTAGRPAGEEDSKSDGGPARPGRCLVFGAGYLGLRVARLWRAQGRSVHAATRSAARAELLRQEGLLPLIADVTRPETLTELTAADVVLFAVAPDAAQRGRALELYEQGLLHVLAALPAGVGRFVFISTTGVYGPADGDWVNEETPCHPRRESGAACLAAEGRLRESSLGARAVILRLAGIYGPGRLPRKGELLAGTPIAAADSGWLNLIHVDDAAEAVRLAAASPVAPGRTYVVSDGHPVDRGEYLRELARQLGAPPPRFVAPEPGAPASTRVLDNKRVDSGKFRAELNFAPGRTDYRAGLAAILAQEGYARPEATPLP